MPSIPGARSTHKMVGTSREREGQKATVAHSFISFRTHPISKAKLSSSSFFPSFAQSSEGRHQTANSIPPEGHEHTWPPFLPSWRKSGENASSKSLISERGRVTLWKFCLEEWSMHQHWHFYWCLLQGTSNERSCLVKLWTFTIRYQWPG